MKGGFEYIVDTSVVYSNGLNWKAPKQDNNLTFYFLFFFIITVHCFGEGERNEKENCMLEC